MTLKIENYNNLEDLKNLKKEELAEFANNLRSYIIEVVSKTGGHLGASLGVVELTVALHYVFSSYEDKIIWDVGHQCYPHKVLTGRKEELKTIRKLGGLSGFTNIFESKHDVFGAGHSSTSISAGLGISAILKNIFTIPVIGDGAISAGMAFEGLNNAFETCGKMIIILNDNDMSISPPTGAISTYLPKLANSSTFLEFKKNVKSILPEGVTKVAQGAEKILKNAIVGENMFEAFGLKYFGPINGHNVNELVEILTYLKETIKQGKPVLLHIKTEKGKGYKPAENSFDKFHGVTPFSIESGAPLKASGSGKSFSLVASEKLVEMAKTDPLINAITPAMKAGSMLEGFAMQFKERFFDVGIAEQHAVTFAAGMAVAGAKPYCFIYSTFLQRAYDQLIHDVALQNLPVRFIIDRAGIVGEDGATHNGVFDASFLRIIPNMCILSPSSKQELELAMQFSSSYNSSPIAIRFARGQAKDLENEVKPYKLGEANIVKKGTEITFVCLGITLFYAIEVCKSLNLNATIIDARFLKPLDEALLKEEFKTSKHIITIEDGSIGGLYSAVLELYNKHNYPSKIHGIYLKDEFIEHATILQIHEEQGLTGEKLKNFVQTLS